MKEEINNFDLPEGLFEVWDLRLLERSFWEVELYFYFAIYCIIFEAKPYVGKVLALQNLPSLTNINIWELQKLQT